MDAKELKKVLDDHRKWAKGDGGSRADLRRANLRGAYLQRADLQEANLRGADLREADLQEANLRRANLQGADLQRADLCYTVLELMPTIYEWAQKHNLPARIIDGRTLVLARRTRNQRYMCGKDYDLGRVYTAPVFSRDPMTACHPGLCVAEEGEMAVACWMDEAVVAGTTEDYKVRVRRFRTLVSSDEFAGLTAADMEPDRAPGEGATGCTHRRNGECQT